jgi:hypothetical protein
VRLLAIQAAAFLAIAAPASAAAPRVIEDDFPRALAEAKAKDLPLFVDAWAPW